MYSYILINRVDYELSGLIGVVNSLEEATVYFDNKVKHYQKPKKMSDEELVQRALIDNWEIDYIHHYVEVYDGTQKICTFKFNDKTRTLEKQEKKNNELGDDTLF